MRKLKSSSSNMPPAVPEIVASEETELYDNVRSIIANARKTVCIAANTAMVEAYWNNLRNMRQFYLMFPNRHTLCDKLNWSHYRALLA